MHAGLVRARGEILVTMDGDLQNAPEDLPEARPRGRVRRRRRQRPRAARRDSWGRTLPSRVINGMLRRFTRVDISDFGCAFNAYRRSAIEPMLGAIGKQKFTKALVLSSGASVVEVDVTHSPRTGRSRYTPLRLTRLALHVLAGFWPQPIQWIGIALGVLCSTAALVLGVLRRLLLDREVELPGPALRRGRRHLRARHAGLHPRPRRRVPGPDPAGRRGQAAVHDRPRALVELPGELRALFRVFAYLAVVLDRSSCEVGLTFWSDDETGAGSTSRKRRARRNPAARLRRGPRRSPLYTGCRHA